LQGWERFRPAQAWLDQHAGTASSEVRGKFDEFLSSRSIPADQRATLTPEQNESLFQQFVDWQAAQDQKGVRH
jgi:hypothetical protein